MRIKSTIRITLVLLLASMLITTSNIQPINAELLFFDDFNDGVADGWTKHLGTWSVINGEYFTSIGMAANSFSTLDVLNLFDCIVETNLRFTDLVGFRAGIVFRHTDNTHCYAFEISNEYDVAWMIIYTPEHPLYGYKNENMSVSVTIHPNVNYTLKVKIKGDTFTGYLDGQELFSWTDGNYTNGKVGLHAHRADVYFDNFTVWSPPVGGLWIPVNKFELLAPYIGLTILLAVAVIIVGYVKKRKRFGRINSNYIMFIVLDVEKYLLSLSVYIQQFYYFQEEEYKSNYLSL